MSVTTSTYYGFTRVREQSPDANDWAVTDNNIEALSKILKSIEQGPRTGLLGLNYPGAYTPPAAPTITQSGAAGSTTYSYYVVALGPINKVSLIGTTTTGNATLTVTNKNTVTWTAVAGATGYDIIRTVGGATQGSIGLNQAGTSFDDTGLVATPYTPAGEPDITTNATTPVGILTPGASISVRLAYENSVGLETQASPERVYTIPDSGAPPAGPSLTSTQAATPGLPGGTYFYALTKKKDTGETLISEVLSVTLPYDTTYSVTIGFDAISTYADGTNGINIYRSQGLNSTFQLITAITNVSTATFTDTNNILPQNVNVQPPTTNTFNATKSIHISWSDITHPTTVTGLKVYITQQPGIWTTNHLLLTVPITSGAASVQYVDYLGNESLSSGAPIESSQIPSAGPKIDLGTEATGAPILTTDMDFAGFRAKNMNINLVPTVAMADGLIWYDSSVSKFRGRQNGQIVDLSPSTPAINSVTNPSLENNASNIFLVSSNPATATGARITSDAYIGTSSYEVTHTTTGAINASTAVYAQMDPTSATTRTTTARACSPGDIFSGHAAVKVMLAGDTSSGSLTLAIGYYDATGTYIGAPGLSGTGKIGFVIPNFANTWYILKGNSTAPAGAAYVAVSVTTGSFPVTNGVTHAYRFDQLALINATDSTNIVPYFDGDSATAFWKGTAGNSQSVKGGFQHSTLEVGGHDASHIVLGTSDVSTILGRIVNSSDGTQKQVQTIQKAAGNSTSYTNNNTTSQQLADMTVNITPSFVNQWVEVLFGGHFTVDRPGGTLTVAIVKDSVLQDETQRSFSVPTANANISFNIAYHTQLTVASHNFQVVWWVDAGTIATSVAYHRNIVAKLVF